MRSLPAGIISLAAVLIAGCGGSEKTTGVDTTHTTPPDTVAASITAAGVVNQTGPVGTALASPITVVVKNKAGDPLKGKTVLFAIGTGGGSIGSPSVSTDATGQASTTWTLGPTAGTQTATAAVSGLAAITFTATAAPAAAAKIVKVAGDSQTVVAGTAVPVVPTVKVTDANGNPISGALVSFTVGSGGGTVAGSPVNTGADGTAKITSWTLGGTAGANTLVVTSGSISTTFTATGIAGPAASVQITSTNPTSLVPGQTTQLTVTATDAGGNAVTTTPTYASSNSAAVSVSASGLVTAVAQGTATITVTVGTAQATIAFTVVGHSGSIIYDTTAIAGAAPNAAAVGHGDAFVGLGNSAQVARITPAGAVVTTITVGGTPVDLANDATGSTVVVAMQSTDQVSILDLTGNTVAASVAMPSPPVRVVLSSNGKTAYVSLTNGQLAVVSLATKAITATYNPGLAATAFRMAPGDTLLYLAQGSTIKAVNLKTGTTTWTQSVSGASIGDIEISNDGQYLYLANVASGKVDVFQISSATVLVSYDIGGGARYLTKTPDGAELYVVQSSLGRALAMVIGATTNLFSSRNVPVGGLPVRVVFEPSGTWAVIPNTSGWVNFIH